MGRKGSNLRGGGGGGGGGGGRATLVRYRQQDYIAHGGAGGNGGGGGGFLNFDTPVEGETGRGCYFGKGGGGGHGATGIPGEGYITANGGDGGRGYPGETQIILLSSLSVGDRFEALIGRGGGGGGGGNGYMNGTSGLRGTHGHVLLIPTHASREHDEMNAVRYHIVYERDALTMPPSDTPMTPYESDPQRAAELACEMANRHGESGGSVVITVIGPWGGRLLLVEPGDSIESTEDEIRAASINFETER